MTHTDANEPQPGERVYIGVDVHRKSWHITVRTREGVLLSATMPPANEALGKLLHRYGVERCSVVYEAGYFGFGLHDYVVGCGARCLVTPPSLIPTESGNRVKTDKIDSAKLARLLSRGDLRGVWVPDEALRSDRSVLRLRTWTIRKRTRIQLQIKAFLNGKFGMAFANQKVSVIADNAPPRNIARNVTHDAPQM